MADGYRQDTVVLRPKKFLTALLLTTAALSAISLALKFYVVSGGAGRPERLLLPLFDSEAENNIPSLYATLLLVTISAACLLIARIDE